MQDTPNINHIYLLIGEYTKHARASAVQLLNLNGVNVTMQTPLKDLQIAFLKAIKDSDSFREQASQAMFAYMQAVKQKVEGDPKYHNLVEWSWWPPGVTIRPDHPAPPAQGGRPSTPPPPPKNAPKSFHRFAGELGTTGNTFYPVGFLGTTKPPPPPPKTKGFAGEPGTTGNTIYPGGFLGTVPPPPPKKKHFDGGYNATGGTDSVDYTDTADSYNAAFSPVTTAIAPINMPTINSNSVSSSLLPQSGVAASGSSSSGSSSSSGGLLGSLIGLIPSVIKTGLNVVSTQATSKANQSSEQSAILYQQQVVAAEQAKAQAAAATGMSTGGKVLMWTAIIAGLAGITFIAVKIAKRKRAS